MLKPSNRGSKRIATKPSTPKKATAKTPAKKAADKKPKNEQKGAVIKDLKGLKALKKELPKASDPANDDQLYGVVVNKFLDNNRKPMIQVAHFEPDRGCIILTIPARVMDQKVANCEIGDEISYNYSLESRKDNIRITNLEPTNNIIKECVPQPEEYGKFKVMSEESFLALKYQFLRRNEKSFDEVYNVLGVGYLSSNHRVYVCERVPVPASNK